MCGGRLDYDDDDFYERPETGILAVRAALWAGVVALLLLVGWHARAHAQDANAGADQPRPLNLQFPDYFNGLPIDYSATVVDAIVRAQRVEYLQSVLKSLLPPPADFKVGKVDSAPGPSVVPAVRIAGRVVETAQKVECIANLTAPAFTAPARPTYAGYPKVWVLDLPEAWQDGLTRGITCRAMDGTGAALGHLDNASPAVPYLLKVGEPASAALEGSYLVGRNMPAGAVKALLMVNGSYGLPGNPAPVANGEWRWRLQYVTSGASFKWWVRAQDAAGRTLWEQSGVSTAP